MMIGAPLPVRGFGIGMMTGARAVGLFRSHGPEWNRVAPYLFGVVARSNCPHLLGSVVRNLISTSRTGSRGGVAVALLLCRGLLLLRFTDLD